MKKSYKREEVINMVTKLLRDTHQFAVSKHKLKGFTTNWLKRLDLLEAVKTVDVVKPKNKDYPTWDELKHELEMNFGKLGYFNNKRKKWRMVKIYKNETQIFKYIQAKYPKLNIELQEKIGNRNDYFNGCVIRFNY